MPQSGLGDIAAGLNETFFGGLAKQRQDAKIEKEKEQARRLAGLHLLLQDPDTTNEGVVDTLEQIAKESGIHKEPLVQNTIAHMRQGMSRQVASGPEQETGQSRVARAESALSAEANVGHQMPMATSIAMRPTTVPGEPGVTSIQAVGTAPMAPSLSVVPPEPVMYQPTRAYGELTRAETEEARKNETFIAQQKAILDRQAQLADAQGDRQAARDIQRQKDQLEQITAKAEESRKTQTALFENKIKMIEPEMQAKARLRVTQIAAALDPKTPYDERLQQARDMAFAEIQVGMEQKKQQIAQSKAAIEHWKRQDANQLLAINKRGEGVGTATAGMTAAEARYLRAQTLEVVPDLNDARKQLDGLYRLQTAVNGTLKPGQPNYDTTYDAQIAAQEKRRDDALERIRSTRQEILDKRQSASPAAPSQSGTRTMEGAIQAFKNDPRNPSHRAPTAGEIARMKAALGQ